MGRSGSATFLTCRKTPQPDAITDTPAVSNKSETSRTLVSNATGRHADEHSISVMPISAPARWGRAPPMASVTFLSACRNAPESSSSATAQPTSGSAAVPTPTRRARPCAASEWSRSFGQRGREPAFGVEFSSEHPVMTVRNRENMHP